MSPCLGTLSCGYQEWTAWWIRVLVLRQHIWKYSCIYWIPLETWNSKDLSEMLSPPSWTTQLTLGSVVLLKTLYGLKSLEEVAVGRCWKCKYKEYKNLVLTANMTIFTTISTFTKYQPTNSSRHWLPNIDTQILSGRAGVWTQLYMPDSKAHLSQPLLK